MKRITLFVLTNLAVLAVVAAVLHALGVQGMLDERGAGIGVPSLLVISLVFGMGGSFVSLLLSKWSAKRLTGARVIASPQTLEEHWLVETVRRQAQAAGIGMPEVAVYSSDDPNAFATGARRDAALVAVSNGLLRQMKREEVEAVLAHEVSHVANGDMVTLALVQGVVNSFVIALARVAGYAVDRLVFRTQEGHGPAFLIVSLLAQVAFGILASPIGFWFSRQREFRADRGAARLVGARPMIGALERLKRVADPTPLPEGMAAFGIQGKSGIAGWFSTHPSLDERIDALRRDGL
jgi:heat shock protein HtpX